MIIALFEEIKKGFAVSEANQGHIREACEILETFYDSLAKRTQVLEESVGVMKEELRKNNQEIQLLKLNEQEMQDRLERLENAARRNHLEIP
ncbi:hypothetical protein NDU88_000215 [Pleurodeles waltl]|uniref:Uncharacterized protein n=1 Tax=Pleurodeles waltl TaxID=8319 RepID=A0AAV7S8W7_PLEWA|nr:hypothetical protein NDU88_000215 [Pleurodeles waltl]